MEHLAQTALEVYKGFLDGNFVAKETNYSFSGVPYDLCLEHTNKTTKAAGRLVAITRNELETLSQSPTTNEHPFHRIQDLCMNWHMMEKMKKDTHKDCLPSSQRRDNNDAFKLVDQFRRYHVIQMENMHELFSLTTGDVASEDILKDPINAADSGKKIVNEFVKKKKNDWAQDFHSTLTPRNTKTFSNLYSTDKPVKLRSKFVKPDRDILHEIIVFMDSGREVNRWASPTRTVRSPPVTCHVRFNTQTNKADLATILQAGVKETELSLSVVSIGTIIDGMALVRAIVKPVNA